MVSTAPGASPTVSISKSLACEVIMGLWHQNIVNLLAALQLQKQNSRGKFAPALLQMLVRFS
jgi:hypothetical protein